MKLKFKVILILAAVFWATNIGASALKITPSSLHLDVVSEKTEQKTLTIENPGNNVALFEIYPDDFSDWINVSPASFILNPGEKRQVVISANSEKEGVYVATLSVVSKPLSERELKANAGAKIPLEIRVSENKPEPWSASIFKNFKRLFDNQQGLIYILSITSVLILFGLLAARKKEVKL